MCVRLPPLHDKQRCSCTLFGEVILFTSYATDFGWKPITYSSLLSLGIFYCISVDVYE